jgi:RNA polymerase sigma factor for flagellar operon FliA
MVRAKAANIEGEIIELHSFASDRTEEYESINDLVARHSELVGRIAHHLITRMPPNVQINDLMQAGMIGLIEASRKFDASQPASFYTFASIRIRGAMLDELRKGDWVPRSVHRRLRALTEAIRSVEQQTGRPAKSSEIAAAMNIPIGDLEKLLADVVRGRVLSMDACVGIDDDLQVKDEGGKALAFAYLPESPAEFLDDHEFRSELADAIDNLPERESLVLSLHYEKELNLTEIGAVLDVSKSRVCQIHAQAIVRLRSWLHEWVGYVLG